MNSSVKNIFKASGAASLGQVLNVLNQLALVPLYMKVWGPQLYGEWLILSAAPSVIAMAGDLGFGTVAANEMNMAVARQDKPYALQVFQNNWLVISAFSLLFFSLAALALPFVSVEGSLNIHHIAPTDARLMIALFLANILLVQQYSLLLAALRCDGNYVLGLTFNNFSKILELGLLATLLALYHAPPVVVAATSVSVTVLMLVVNRILVQRKSPWIRYGFRLFSPAIIRTQTPIALSFLSFSITQALSIQGAVMLVGFLMGPAAVVVLSTTRTFMNVIKQVAAVVNTSIWPELTTAYGQGNMAKFQLLFTRALQAILLLVLGFNLAVWVVGKPLYLFWTKHKLLVENSFFYPYALITSLNALWTLFGVVQGATNQTKRYALYHLGSSALMLLGILALSKPLGMPGVLLAIGGAELFMLVFVVKNALGILQIKSFASFWTDFTRLPQRSVAFE